MPTREELAEVVAIFSEAVDLDPVARAALLDARCDGRPAVRTEIESLIAVHGHAGTFLEAGGRLRDEPAVVNTVEGTHVGAWRLLEKIGSGGMGDVYLAERADGAFEGRAAIKFTRAHLPDMDAARRFRAERQFLASLHHPNIVTLLDGGTTPAGQGYLVMEYVEGTPISAFCQARALTLDARLALIRQVCAAVHYAHQRAIVHRDLKPTNILVTSDGVPKILDFGVAKLLEGSAGDGNATIGAMGPLTPNYASPEQLRGLPISTACDVYSLGVLLYEAVAGARPYETTGLTLDAVMRAVVETEPFKPSATSSDASLPYARATLRGDLDAIVLKAMQKEPERRYGSAGELADDLARFRDRRPVVAQPDRAGYRIGKFVRRHRFAVAAAGIALASLVTGLGVALWQARTAGVERDRARLETAKAQQVSVFLRTLFSSQSPREAHGEKLTAQDLLDAGVKRLDTELGGQPDVQASMLEALGWVYSDLSQYRQALPLLERSLVLREHVFGPDHVEVANSLLALGRMKRMSSGDYAADQRLLERAVRIREKVVGPEDPQLPAALDELANALLYLGKNEEARNYLRRAVSIEEKRGGPLLPRLLSSLAVVTCCGAFDDFDTARALFERVIEMGVQIDGRRSERIDVAMLNLASLLRRLEEFDRAQALLEECLAIGERVYGTEHQAVIYTWGELGDLYLAIGDRERARSYIDRSIAGYERLVGVNHPSLAEPLIYRAHLLEADGKLRDALASQDRALEIRRRALGTRHAEIADSLAEIAYLKARLEGDAVAEPLLRTAIAMQRDTLVAGHRQLVPTLTALGEMVRARGSTTEAQGLLREAVDIARKKWPERHSQRVRAEAALVKALK